MPGPARGRGRPPKAEPRELNIGFKVTAREYQYLQALAWKERTSIGAVVRRLALAGLPVEASPTAPGTTIATGGGEAP